MSLVGNGMSVNKTHGKHVVGKQCRRSSPSKTLSVMHNGTLRTTKMKMFSIKAIGNSGVRLISWCHIAAHSVRFLNHFLCGDRKLWRYHSSNTPECFFLYHSWCLLKKKYSQRMEYSVECVTLFVLRVGYWRDMYQHRSRHANRPDQWNTIHSREVAVTKPGAQHMHKT